MAFSVGSIIPALLFGVAVGNVLRGLALDAQGNDTGTFFDLLNPYSLLAAVGVPVVLGYTAWAYRTFRGKVALDDSSY